MKLIVILSMLLFSVSLVKAQSKEVLHFIDEYQSIAHQKINESRFTIEKWEGKDTLYYKIEGELVYIPNKSFKKYLAQIEGLTGIAFTETEDKEKADILMFLGNLNDYFQYINSILPDYLPGNLDNWANRKYTTTKQLMSATFCVDTEKTKTPDRFTYLVKRGILKSIGFWGQSDNEYSMFYKQNTRYNSNLSKNDKRVIKLHYNSSIKANMSVSELKETLLKNIDIESLLKEKL